MLPPVIVAHEWGAGCKILRTRPANRHNSKTSELLIN